MLYGDFEGIKRETSMMRRAILAFDEFLEAIKPGTPGVLDTKEYRRAYYKARSEVDEYRQFLDERAG